ncbi:rho GTPase-activating protein REN1 isoform X2 [Diospyros lotus]|uniref:rho GTPase-activating protein REN1 isoform X2 n=1 Tax=Diospyros lotus TaxID=55363 RepID=UPI00225B0830|nr:rho GTPase-activating protein REN1 isoform X2 [Diospyros lotus]
MTKSHTDTFQGESGNPQHPQGPARPPDSAHTRGGNKVFKSGPLFLSSKGIGWTSWKKRWFILTRTSLVFSRSDPNAAPQKGSEVNLILGGIDLNNSGSVVVKADKKLLTVLFPDGRDGRAFTLKAETLEDLYEWKAALEEALAQAPSATLVMGQNGILNKNEQAESDAKEKQPVKSFVIGRPILLALEDIDGTPSFLEKALRFVEEHGVKVEGILRQAADVDDVEHRIREYEQGKTDFSVEEDAHVIADCVKYVIRELPSSPVPASCCNALLEACRTDRSRRVAAMREAICETFPEPNRRLLQRILMMMQKVASHKNENRMSSSAVAACMAPLLLRPLLAGDCELENDFDVGGDGSVQLLQAAAAANHAQAICITLLEEYDSIFGENAMSTELYSDSEETGTDSEELSDDYDEDDEIEDDGDEDGTEGSDAELDEDSEHASDEAQNKTGKTGDEELYNDKRSDGPSLDSESNESNDQHKVNQKSSSSSHQSSSVQHDNVQISEALPDQSYNGSAMQANESAKALGDDPAEPGLIHDLTDESSSSHIQKSTAISDEAAHGGRRTAAVWGRAPAKKNLSMETIEFSCEDEAEIERLEATKIDLQNQVEEEAKGNAVLQASLESKKNALLEHRLALEQDVARLQEQLQKERELRTVLLAGLKTPQGSYPFSASVDKKTKAELEEIARVEADVINLKQTADDLGVQLNQQREQNFSLAHGSGNQLVQTPNHESKLKEKDKDIETTSTLYGSKRSTRSKNDQLDKVDSDREIQEDFPISGNKNFPQNQQSDPVHNSKYVGTTGTLSSAEALTGRVASVLSKKSGIRGEGANASSALSRLTNRLNFLKERRSQIANELQNMDLERNSGLSDQSHEKSKGSESRQSGLNVDKLRPADGRSVYNSEKGSGLGSSQSIQNVDSAQTAEGHQEENKEKHRKSSCRSHRATQNSDRGKAKDQSAPNLERGKSESFPNVDKGRRPEVPPRTYSR